MTARQPSGSFTVTCPDCGYSKTSRTQGLADHGLRKHSCENHRARTARAEREAKRKFTGGVKRECTCKRVKHEHGDRTMYVKDKCRCRKCRNAMNAVRQKEIRDKAYGRYDTGRVDAGPVRERCFWLGENGIGIKRLAKITGLSTGTLGKIMYGTPSKNQAPRARVEKATAEKIMAVVPALENMAPGHPVDATGTRRRVQALMTLGYSRKKIGELLGISSSNMLTFVTQPTVSARKAIQVREIYDRLWDVPAPAVDWHSRTSVTKSKKYATAHGYAPPLAWDEDTIDDPAATPEGVEKVSTYGKAGTDRVEDIEHLLDGGTAPAEIPDRIGLTLDTIERSLWRAGRHDLAARLKPNTNQNREIRRAA